MPDKQTIGFIPQDDRPVSSGQAVLLAELAGYKVLTPPSELLGHKFSPGAPDAVCDWYRENFRRADGWVIALDMPAYGGLVASRELTGPTDRILRRMNRLATSRKDGRPVLACQAVRRLSVSVKTAEDVEKWRRHHSRNLLAQARRRNHLVNLKSLELLKNGALDFLSLLQEDARANAGQEKEHRALRSFVRKHGLENRFSLTTGTDEGALLTIARLICLFEGRQQKAELVFSSADGAGQTALYEDRPLRDTVAGQLKAAGVSFAGKGETADFKLMVWCPPVKCRDLVFQPPVRTGDKRIKDFISRIRQNINRGDNVSVADLAFANGADPAFARALARIPECASLSGFSAWNTAANATGFAVAQAMLNVKSRKFLALRFTEDWGYQTEFRPILAKHIRTALAADIWALDAKNLPAAEKFLGPGMKKWAEKNLPDELKKHAVKFKYTLPWERTFEVEPA